MKPRVALSSVYLCISVHHAMAVQIVSPGKLEETLTLFNVMRIALTGLNTVRYRKGVYRCRVQMEDSLESWRDGLRKIELHINEAPQTTWKPEIGLLNVATWVCVVTKTKIAGSSVEYKGVFKCRISIEIQSQDSLRVTWCQRASRPPATLRGWVIASFGLFVRHASFSSLLFFACACFPAFLIRFCSLYSPCSTFPLTQIRKQTHVHAHTQPYVRTYMYAWHICAYMTYSSAAKRTGNRFDILWHAPVTNAFAWWRCLGDTGHSMAFVWVAMRWDQGTSLQATNFYGFPEVDYLAKAT